MSDVPSSSAEIADVFKPADLEKVSQEVHEATGAHIDYFHIAHMAIEVGLWVLGMLPTPAAPAAHVKVTSVVQSTLRSCSVAPAVGSHSRSSWRRLQHMFEEIHAKPFPHGQSRSQPPVRTSRDMLEQVEIFERAKVPNVGEMDEKSYRSPQEVLQELNTQDNNSTNGGTEMKPHVAMSEVLNILEGQTGVRESGLDILPWLEQLCAHYEAEDMELSSTIAEKHIPERINGLVQSIPKPPEEKVPSTFDDLY
ncbi:hypothetical protein HIM_08541 [Hirsutella minnesotensis 3608]|uniref:Uncharacterized protein n=1 Tax=Hirsutella minnesotensis 3608 TaxID=1043627 RepID=A0A0F7ZH62_9HYPO|nr:hypothetical protein HIM_08541 [Hirsutella minnesotensis 3608]